MCPETVVYKLTSHPGVGQTELPAAGSPPTILAEIRILGRRIRAGLYLSPYRLPRFESTQPQNFLTAALIVH